MIIIKDGLKVGGNFIIDGRWKTRFFFALYLSEDRNWKFLFSAEKNIMWLLVFKILFASVSLFLRDSHNNNRKFYEFLVTKNNICMWIIDSTDLISLLGLIIDLLFTFSNLVLKNNCYPHPWVNLLENFQTDIANYWP